MVSTLKLQIKIKMKANVWKRDAAITFPAIYVLSRQMRGKLNLSHATLYEVKVEMKVRVKDKVKVEVRKRDATVTFPGSCVFYA